MDHHKVDFENVARVVMALGLAGFKNLSAQMPACSVKYAGLTLGEAEAIFNVLGEANMQRILAGEATIEIIERISKLVDKNGRLIPLAGSKNDVCDSNPNSRLVQPKIDYVKNYNRFIKFFPGLEFVSVEEFEERSKSLLVQLGADPLLSNLLRGVYLPVCYPKFRFSDYGEDLEAVFLKAVSNSYEEHFPNRKFIGLNSGFMRARAGIVDESHSRFIAKMSEAPLVGIQFFPLQGFSVNAQREMMSVLPNSLHLSGPIDLATALTAYPCISAGENNAPSFDCAAVYWRTLKGSLYFQSEGSNLRLKFSESLSKSYGDFSGGLVYLG